MTDPVPEQEWFPWDPATDIAEWVRVRNGAGWFQPLTNDSRPGPDGSIEFLFYFAGP